MKKKVKKLPRALVKKQEQKCEEIKQMILEQQIEEQKRHQKKEDVWLNTSGGSILTYSEPIVMTSDEGVEYQSTYTYYTTVDGGVGVSSTPEETGTEAERPVEHIAVRNPYITTHAAWQPNDNDANEPVQYQYQMVARPQRPQAAILPITPEMINAAVARLTEERSETVNALDNMSQDNPSYRERALALLGTLFPDGIPAPVELVNPRRRRR